MNPASLREQEEAGTQAFVPWSFCGYEALIAGSRHPLPSGCTPRCCWLCVFGEQSNGLGALWAADWKQPLASGSCRVVFPLAGAEAMSTKEQEKNK